MANLFVYVVEPSFDGVDHQYMILSGQQLLQKLDLCSSNSIKTNSITFRNKKGGIILTITLNKHDPHYFRVRSIHVQYSTRLAVHMLLHLVWIQPPNFY